MSLWGRQAIGHRPEAPPSKCPPCERASCQAAVSIKTKLRTKLGRGGFLTNILAARGKFTNSRLTKSFFFETSFYSNFWYLYLHKVYKVEFLFVKRDLSSSWCLGFCIYYFERGLCACLHMAGKQMHCDSVLMRWRCWRLFR